MEYLRVKNWSDFQQYKDREPKWIKVYRSLLMDYKYEQLTDLEFGQLVKIWLLASQLGNEIPNDQAWIQKKTGMTQKPNIDKLLQLDFLQLNHSVQNCTELYKNVPREEKIREEKRRYGDFVFLLESHYENLCVAYGKKIIDAKISDLNNYIGSTGRKYKSHYHTLLNWLKREGIQPTEQIIECPKCKGQFKESDVKDGKCPVCKENIVQP